jgi:hypothetical protein
MIGSSYISPTVIIFILNIYNHLTVGMTLKVNECANSGKGVQKEELTLTKKN